MKTNIRQALVIGNANYAHSGVLRNPANDARAIGGALERLGFRVATLTEANKRQIDKAIRKFGRQLRGSNGVGLFYYAEPGNVAADGEGNNGFFTEKLLKHMTTPGLKLEEVLQRVRSDVQQDSNNKQVPWDSSSVTGDFFFVPAESVTAAAPVALAQSNEPSPDFAAQAWDFVKGLEDPAIVEEFIKMFPEAPQLKRS